MKKASGATDSAAGEAAAAPAGGRYARAGGAGAAEGGGAHDVSVPQDQPARGAASAEATATDTQAKLQLVVDRDANQREVGIDLQTLEDDEAPVPHPYDDANPSASKLKAPSNAPSQSPHVGGGIDLGTVGGAEEPNHPSQYEGTSQKTSKMTGSVEAVPLHPPMPDEHAALRHDNSLGNAKAKERRMRSENARDSVDEPTTDASDAQPIQRDAGALSSTLSAIFGRRQQREDARAPNPIAVGGDRAIAADVEAAVSPYVNDNDEICIPEATAVTPDEEIPVGTVVRPEKNSLTIAGRKFQLRFVILAVIALLALAIVLAVTLTRKRRGPADAPTSAPSVSLFPSSQPSTQPSLGPTTILQAELMEVISNYSGGVVSSSFADSQSAHRQALQWLVDDQTVWLQEKRPLPDAELVERFVLALIYFGTYGKGWNQRLRFTTEDHICKWRDYYYQYLKKGVTKCTGHGAGLVTNLTLSGNKLKGGLPTEIGLLKELEALHFGENDIEGSIPASLGSLTNLTHLELQNNDLAGTAPSSLSSLKNLRSIDLSDNEMTGSLVDAGGMTELENYKAAGNRFSGPVPESFSNISSLEILHLQFNQLSGDIDFMCDNLPSDYRLDCGGDKPEISCNCCPGCTFVEDESCDHGTEKALTLEIYPRGEDSNFAWTLEEETYTQGQGYEWSTIAAGGQYDDGEALTLQLCLNAPGYFKMTTSTDTPIPTYRPTSDTPYPSPTWDFETDAPMPVSAPPLATEVPTPPPLEDNGNSNKVFCDSLTGREECNIQSKGKCVWDTESDMCFVNDPVPSSPPSVRTAELCPPAYNASLAATYIEGMEVEVDGIVYRCNLYPFSIYCTFPSYHPGSSDGTAWEDAWEEIGSCAMLTVGPSTAPSERLTDVENTPWPTPSPTASTSPTATTSPTQYTRLVCSIDGVTRTLGPNDGWWFEVIAFPTMSPTESPSISAFPTTSTLPTSGPSHSSRPSSSSRPSAPTPFPTYAPTYAPTNSGTSGLTPTVGTNKTESPTPFITRPAEYRCEDNGLFNLNLMTDAFGMDTSYEVIDRNDDSILLSRTGFPSNTTVQEDACLKRRGCYDFVIYDEWDDGICCKQGRGSYQVLVDGFPYGGGGAFGSSETVFLGGTCGGNATGWLLLAGPSPAPITPFPTPSGITPFPTDPTYSPTTTFPTMSTQPSSSIPSPTFICPQAAIVGCTALDPSNLVDECSTVGEPCNADEFCCMDACPRNYCTAKQAPER